MPVIGFTGTQNGMTDAQKDAVNDYLVSWLGKQVIGHHGDCIGADVEFGAMCQALGYKIRIRPGHDSKGRQPKRGYGFRNVEFPSEPYLERNKKIVDECAVLVACPKSNREEQRSGTWFTIRYAEETGKPVTIFWPNGKREDR